MVKFKQMLWESYGFRENPFDTSALSFCSGTNLSIKEAFVVRKDCQASQLLTNILCSAGGNRLVLEGQVGVGKTTFVNYHKFLWETEAEDRLFAPIVELSFGRDWTVHGFLINVLSLCMNKLLLIKGESFVRKHPLCKEIMLLHKVYNRDTYQVEASLLGVGGGIGKDEKISLPPIPESQLFQYYRDMVALILSLGYKGIILHFDNVELLNKESIQQAKGFLEDIRDFLQVRYVYHIFVASPGFFQQIIAPLPRVRSVFFGWPIVLKPLSKEETLQAIALRYKLLAMPGIKFIKPVEDGFIEYLYDVYDGQIRFIMDAIHAIILHYPPSFPKILRLEEAQPLLKKLILERMEQSLSPKELEILTTAAGYNKFTNLQLSQVLAIQPQNINKYLQGLIDKGYVHFLEKQGRSVFYGVSAEARILKGFGDQPGIFPVPLQEIAVNERQQRLLRLPLQEIRTEEYGKLLNVSVITARRDLCGLEKLGYLKRNKQGRTVVYKIIKECSG